MTSGTVAFPVAARETTRAETARRTLVELALVGAFTPVLFPLAWALRRMVGLDDAELAVGFTTFYLAYVVNDPHFSVTYLLFYKDAKRRAFGRDVSVAQRARWLVAGVVVPIALVAWAAVALATRSAETLGWMVQAMFLLVGWHYAKQGFGVLTVLSARRGVAMTPRERTVVLAHSFAGWAYAWASPAVASGEYEEKGVVYHAIARPAWLEIGTGAILGVSTIALVVVLAAKWRRERALPWGPLAAFLVTIWSWTIWSSIDPLVRYVIPALHAIQYFYFVWLMKRNEARASEGPPTFGRPASVRLAALALTALVLGWLLFRGVPTFLDTAFVKRGGDGALGETPFFAAFFVAVNIHHYFMDHVVWRRENPDTRFLRGDAR